MFREAEFSVRTGREIREDQNITSKQQVERKNLGLEVMDWPLGGRVEAGEREGP